MPLRGSSLGEGSSVSLPAPAGAAASSSLSTWRLAALVLTIFFVTGMAEWLMGRSLLGPDGRFGLWEGTIWSSECSQRVADPYSFSHVVHGVLFYFGLWLIGRKRPVRERFVWALLIEAGWEVLENSPVIINRYRQTAIALGYNGDSVLNSASDIVMMALGFLLAARVRPWKALLLVLLMEAGCAYYIRDNLVLNVVALIHPVKAIERWQAATREPPHSPNPEAFRKGAN